MHVLFLNTYRGELQKPLTELLSRKKHTTDVFCLQEADEYTRKLCREALPEYTELHAKKSLSSDENKNDYDQALYLAPGVTLLGSGTLFDDEPHAGFVLYADLELDGDIVSLANVHGYSIRNVDRKLDTPGRIALSKAVIDLYLTSENPVIIGGDFNVLPEAGCIQQFSDAGYRDLIKDYEVATTRNHYAWDRYPHNPQMYADFIFTNALVTVSSFTVLPDLVSDHQPLLLDVAFSTFELLESDAAQVSEAA